MSKSEYEEASDDSGSDAGSQRSGRSSKSGKSNASSAGGGGNRQQPCRFFKSGTGCSKGAECPFRHGQLKPTDGQCFNCGAKGHSKADCPNPKVKAGNRKGSIDSEAGGRPAGESDAEEQPRSNRQLEGFLKTVFRAAQQLSSRTSGQRDDPMVKICHLSSDCGEVWPTPHPAVNQEEADYVQKCADRCSCSRRKFGSAIVPKGAGHEWAKTRSEQRKSSNDPYVLIDSGASVSIEPMPASWKNGRKIPSEAKFATVVLGVGAVDGYKLGDTVYTWPSAGVVEPLIPWGRWSAEHDMQADLNPTSNDPHVVHAPTGLKFPITWINACPHILQSQRRELEMASKLGVLPEPDKIPRYAVRMIANHLKGP